MALLCWMEDQTLTIRNEGPRALSLGRGARIAIEFAGDAPPAPCAGFDAATAGSRLTLTSSRRERWWYPRELLTLPLPPGARAVSVAFENSICEVASGRPAERSSESVLINSFTCEPMVLGPITAPATVQLSWTTTNASTVTLSGVGKVNLSQSSLPVTIEQTTTFVLTAYDSALDQIASQALTVRVDPPLISRVVAPGTIALWSGEIDDKPEGWLICDGNDGTPNLTDRFILGAGGSEVLGAYGEEETHTHEVPAASDDATTSTEPDHSHKLPAEWYPRDFDGGDYSGIDTDGEYQKDNTYTQSAGEHSHSVYVQMPRRDTGANEGSVRPRWIALYYIMKGK